MRVRYIVWIVLFAGFFGITLKLGVWYGRSVTPLELGTQVVRVETENIFLRDKVAALEVDSVVQGQQVQALVERMVLYERCAQKKWRGC